jgi:hypothetical protein
MIKPVDRFTSLGYNPNLAFWALKFWLISSADMERL